MSIPIYQPVNCIILPITKNGRVYNFFVDTGCPISFSADPGIAGVITNEDLRMDQVFHLNLRKPLFDLTSLSERLMIDLAGILGSDFVALFDNIKIDFVKKEIDFNVPNFTPELEVNFLDGPGSENYLLASLSIGSRDNWMRCVVDTGASQSISLNQVPDGYPKSEGWRFSTPYGDNTAEFYSGIEIYAPGIDFGKHIVGCPLDFPPAPFEFVMGLNILSQYECCFNMKERKLQLRSNPRKFRLGADITGDTYSTGLQLINRDGKLQVYNILPGFDTAPVGIGDCIELEGINLDDPEAANQVLDKMSSEGEEKEVKISINNETLTIKTARLFKEVF
jgi:hypothetical protein